MSIKTYFKAFFGLAKVGIVSVMQLNTIWEWVVIKPGTERNGMEPIGACAGFLISQFP